MWNSSSGYTTDYTTGFIHKEHLYIKEFCPRCFKLSQYNNEWKENSKEHISNINLESQRQGRGWLAGQMSTESAAACVCCVVQCVEGKTTPEGFHCVKVTMSAVSSWPATRGDKPAIRAGVALSACCCGLWRSNKILSNKLKHPRLTISFSQIVDHNPKVGRELLWLGDWGFQNKWLDLKETTPCRTEMHHQLCLFAGWLRRGPLLQPWAPDRGASNSDHQPGHFGSCSGASS